MTRVILIRHAKSAWDDPFADDHARDLTERGKRSATAIGAWLAEKGYLPDRVVSSDAVRTVSTARGILAALPGTPDLIFESRLYHASPDTMLDVLQSTPGDCVAMIGHNPGMALLARGLVELRPDHNRFGDYPTCATTVIDFDAKAAPHMGRCLDFVIPRELGV